MSKNKNNRLHKQIKKLYQLLLKTYGWKKWWPSTPLFEIIVGAILVQNTNWKNVDHSLRNLRDNIFISAESINKITIPDLISFIKPSGLHHKKAKYLKTFSEWYLKSGGYEKLKYQKTVVLRRNLLELRGIGKETADVILLYVFHRPVFIIDKYTQRLLMEVGLIKKKLSYDVLQQIFHDSLIPNRRIYSEYHALIVHNGKIKDKKRGLMKQFHSKLRQVI